MRAPSPAMSKILNGAHNTQQRMSYAAAVFVLGVIWLLWLLDLHPHFGTPRNTIQGGLASLQAPPSVPTTPITSDGTNTTTLPVSDRPLVLYAFFETELARTNLEFFLAHALHGNADFLFILNGDTDAEDILPKLDNVGYVKRKNDCYDLGAFAEVLLRDELYKRYTRFITMNASVRGPFFPYWSKGCWTDIYLGKLTEEVKLVGMTLNCQAPEPHVQSMIWALDRTTIDILLFPTETQISALKSSLSPLQPDEPVPAFSSPGISSCPHEYWEAVAIEVYATPLIKAAGYKVDTMMLASHSDPRYQDDCLGNKDVLFEGTYFGTNIHPFDTIFAKTNRGTDPLTLQRLTEWTVGRNYSSWDYCH